MKRPVAHLAAGFAAGALVVGGIGYLVSDGSGADPQQAEPAGEGYCAAVAALLPGGLGLGAPVEETITEGVDVLTTCVMADATGVNHFTIAVQRVGSTAVRGRPERAGSALRAACDDLLVPEEDGSCSGPVGGGTDDPAGAAVAFVTEDGRAVVTAALSGSSGQDAATEALGALRSALEPTGSPAA